jgi:hypothetical protein
MKPQSKISKYFRVYEIGKSAMATRLRIDNTPPVEVIDKAAILAETVLDRVRTEFGPLSPQSWFRCEDLEKVLTWNSGFARWCRINKKPHDNLSWPMYFRLKSHPRGEAVDIEYPHIDNEVLYLWIRDEVPMFDQLILEFFKPEDPNSGWVHVSRREEGNRLRAFEYGGE